MTLNPAIFREYDIRGVADRDLPNSLVTDLGRAIGTHLRDAGAQRISVGRDCRTHSDRLRWALMAGLTETGLEILDLGVVPTPLVYYSTFRFDLDGAVQITGSHNPAEDNGFKICRGKTTIHGDEIQKLRRLVEGGKFHRSAKASTVREADVVTPYLQYVKGNIQTGKRRFRVVVDGGSGTGGPVGVRALQALGFEVVPLYCEMDGRFPHHHPDPTVPKNLEDLRREVARRGAEVGIAYDGDADRLGVVDAKGRILWGDQLLMLFAREILKEQPGATFVSEVKCSQALYDDIEARGGRAIMWKVGHSLIKTKMKEEKAVLAGEMSGHLFFAHRYFGYDDAVYASLRLIELLSRSDRTLAEIYDTLPVVHSTPEIRMDCPDAIKFEVVRRAQERFRQRYKVIDVDGARILFPDGWGLVRASNTGPVLVLRFEAASPERLEQIRMEVEAELRAIRKLLGAA